MTLLFKLILSPVGRWVSGGLLILALLCGVWLHGENHGDNRGAARIQAKWDAAVSAAIERGVKARTDAERSVERDGDAPSVSDDKFFRD